MKINIKTKEEIGIMRKGGKMLSEIMKKTLERAKPGVRTIELERFADREINKRGAKASFKTVKGYQYATCMCLNSTVVHGLPGNDVLKENDVLGVDMGVLYKGFHTDMSWTKLIQNDSVKFKNIRENPKIRFLEIGKEALENAIAVCRVGNYVWDISKAIQDVVEKKGGYHSIRVLTGHGVGRKLHEDPIIPCFAEGKREKSAKLNEGMTLAIEVIYAVGTDKVWYGNEDGWTITTRDSSLAGLFECTLAVAKKSPEILTSCLNNDFLV